MLMEHLRATTQKPEQVSMFLAPTRDLAAQVSSCCSYEPYLLGPVLLQPQGTAALRCG